MQIITDNAALGRLRALDQALSDASALVNIVTAELRQAEVRRETVSRSCAEHEIARPEPDQDASDALSDALAENPEAARSQDWLGRVRELQAAHTTAVDAWQAEHTILMHAGAKLARHVDEITARLEAAREAHENAYRDFLIEAHDAIVAEFEARWEGITADLLAPLASISRARKLYGGELHQLGFRRALHPDGQLNLQWPDLTVAHTGRGSKRLFPVTVSHGDAAPIEAFRAAVASKT